MYKILIADDEGIMLESLKTLILKNFPGECEIECVKTGRAAVEVAERFLPDIAFLDIQMPGLNGIQAMHEIRKYNDFTLFIIVTAFDRFSFAKEAINLGVIEYLTKPVNHKIIVDVLMRAMKIVDENHMKLGDDTKVRERMAAVMPIIENAFLFSILMADDFPGRADSYKELLDIREDFVQILVIEWGDDDNDGILTNPIGAGVKSVSHEDAFRDFIRESFDAVPGRIMGNRMVALIARAEESSSLSERTLMIEKSLHFIRRMKSELDMRYRVGIGSVRPFSEARESYRESLRAMAGCRRTICHYDDYSTCEDCDAVLAQAKQYIADNYSRDLSVETVANAVGISSYYFVRFFKEKTGERVMEYITNVRMEAASKLLSDPILTVKEVCATCGYMDQSYFGRVFHKRFGVTPEEFKEINQ